MKHGETSRTALGAPRIPSSEGKTAMQIARPSLTSR